ncbi:MAG TPA: hypothetical protein VM889_01245 [Candidatus Thermoplasmatota archaeon]|nr:hypothetical protein [Candidatus Thermoplasmatota archaeon]
MVDASPFVALELSQYEVYGLFFLLGSFVVASVSDLKHLSAQREFMDVWIAVAVILFILDLANANWRPDAPFLVKWGLVILLSLLSWQRVGLVFRLAPADVAACAAAAALLSPLLILLFFMVMKVLSWPLGPLLARGRNVYPFMPVVTLGVVAVLGFAVATDPGLMV